MATENLRDLSDEELIELFRDTKSDASGSDPALTPPDVDDQDPVRREMERRGLAPDRENLIPDDETPGEDPVVEDRA